MRMCVSVPPHVYVFFVSGCESESLALRLEMFLYFHSTFPLPRQAILCPAPRPSFRPASKMDAAVCAGEPSDQPRVMSALSVAEPQKTPEGGTWWLGWQSNAGCLGVIFCIRCIFVVAMHFRFHLCQAVAPQGGVAAEN